MKENLEKVRLLARDLRDGKQYPRSPRETLGGYVLAARAVDKCRAVLVGWHMEEYIARFVPRNRPVYRWFDLYDLEEERL
jgi:hypothetical protein